MKRSPLILGLLTAVSFASFDPILPDEGGSAAVVSLDTMTIAAASTWEAIDFTFVNDLEGFTLVSSPNPGIRYDGDQPRDFRVIFATSVSSDRTGAEIRMGFGVNGLTPVSYTDGGTYLKTSDEMQAFGGGKVTLSNGDVVTLLIWCDGTDDIICYHYQVGIDAKYDRQ